MSFDPEALNLEKITKAHYGEIKALCPFHNDKNVGSFYLNLYTGLYKCFACGAEGNVKQLAEQTGGTILQVKDTPRQTKPIDDGEWRKIGHYPLAIDNPYLKSRGVLNETIEQLSILADNDGNIYFPLPDLMHKEVIGYQRRLASNEGKRYKLFGERPEFYCPLPYNELPDKLFVVEGIFGVINAFQCGYIAVSLLGASGYSKSAVKLLCGFNSVLVFDDDDAGYTNVVNIIKESGGEIHSIRKGVEADEISVEEWDRINDEVPICDISFFKSKIKEF